MSSRTTLSHPSRLEKQTPSGYCPLTALLHPYLPQSVVGIFQKKKKKKGGWGAGACFANPTTACSCCSLGAGFDVQRLAVYYYY
ncbi:hypothetical protein I7I50_10010 [Histoplasma capsulatum G186AR]|nr:hypothetical protein I7I50_10010 [Histoplasma capsulatum G186AR]